MQYKYYVEIYDFMGIQHFFWPEYHYGIGTTKGNNLQELIYNFSIECVGLESAYEEDFGHLNADMQNNIEALIAAEYLSQFEATKNKKELKLVPQPAEKFNEPKEG